MHTRALEALAYDPVGQAVQVEAKPNAANPGGHGTGAKAADKQAAPAGHAVHTVLLSSAYVPLGQAVGEAPSAQANPAGQGWHATLEARANEPGAQATGKAVGCEHADPAGHGRQVADPATAAYEPEVHVTQADRVDEPATPLAVPLPQMTAAAHAPGHQYPTGHWTHVPLKPKDVPALQVLVHVCALTCTHRWAKASKKKRSFMRPNRGGRGWPPLGFRLRFLNSIVKRLQYIPLFPVSFFKFYLTMSPSPRVTQASGRLALKNAVGGRPCESRQ